MEAAVKDIQKESPENVVSENSNFERLPTPPSQEPTKRSRKDDRMKKDDKNVEQFMKSLNSVPSVEEKLSLVCKKFVQTADDNKKMHFYIKQSDKRYTLLLKEKEQLQLEFNKTVLVKSKLENLCRELQKQNKAIKEESLLKIREEEERRKETQAKFQNTLSEITTLLHQNNEKNAKLRDDNVSMSEKFKSVVQQYQLREQQVDKMAKQMALESQLSDAKLQKASLEHQADKERLLAEMEQVKVTVAQYRAKIMELQSTESSLRSQLAVYTDKYDEFQNALVKSNQVFGGFKEQMEKMSKKIKKLEKESLMWKKRWEQSQSALIDMCGERQAGEERAAAAGRQLHHMQSLCRTLQAERTVLLNTLKENNIERPPLPAPPAAPAPPAPLPAHPPSISKVDAMAANCAHLRQSLAHLQSQLNVLTTKQQGAPEEPTKQEKSKKTKSKKNKDKAQKSQDKIESLNPESDDANKEVVEEVITKTKEDLVNIQNDFDMRDDKVDDKTLESLIQAISNANINLCDLEVINNENSTDDVIEEIIRGAESSTKPKIIEITEIESNDEKKVDKDANSSEEKEILEDSNSPEEKKVLDVQNSIEEKKAIDVSNSTEEKKILDVPNVTEEKKILDVPNLTEENVLDAPSVTEEHQIITNSTEKENNRDVSIKKVENLDKVENITNANEESLEVSTSENKNDEIVHMNEVKPIMN